MSDTLIPISNWKIYNIRCKDVHRETTFESSAGRRYKTLIYNPKKNTLRIGSKQTDYANITFTATSSNGPHGFAYKNQDDVVPCYKFYLDDQTFYVSTEAFINDDDHYNCHLNECKALPADQVEFNMELGHEIDATDFITTPGYSMYEFLCRFSEYMNTHCTVFKAVLPALNMVNNSKVIPEMDPFLIYLIGKDGSRVCDITIDIHLDQNPVYMIVMGSQLQLDLSHCYNPSDLLSELEEYQNAYYDLKNKQYYIEFNQCITEAYTWLDLL